VLHQKNHSFSCFLKEKLLVQILRIRVRGIGLLLFKRIIGKAKENDISVIQSLINTDNPPSIKLHKKAGVKISLRKQAILEL